MHIRLSEHFTYGKLIRFTLPTIIMMIFTSLYGIVDGFFVSNCVGADAFAAVNFIWPMFMVFGSIGFMLGTGGSALVSKTLGEGKNEEAQKRFSMLVYLLIILGIIFSIIGIFLIEHVVVWLGAEENMLDECFIYGKIMIAFLVSFMLQNAFQSFLIVAEKPALGLGISLAAGFTNMILDYVFMYVLDMGVWGAGLATGISQVVGGIIPLIYFMRKNNSLLKLVKTKFEWKAVGKACVNGSSEMMTNLSMSLVNILFNVQLLKHIGSEGVIAYGIIMYVSFIFIGTFLGFSIGTAPVIGYHYGAKNYDELKNLLKKSLRLLGVTALILTVISEILSEVLASIFVSYDAELLELTTKALRLFSLSYLIAWFNMFASSFFTALNNGLISAVISFLRTLVFQTIMIFILPEILGIDGIWLAVVFAELLAMIVSAIFLIKNKKKYNYA